MNHVTTQRIRSVGSSASAACCRNRGYTQGSANFCKYDLGSNLQGRQQSYCQKNPTQAVPHNRVPATHSLTGSDIFSRSKLPVSRLLPKFFTTSTTALHTKKMNMG